MLQQRRILVVDDEVEIVSNLKQLLELENFQVETAYSGKEAIQVLRNRPPVDLILCDLTMPAGDGNLVLSEVLVNYPQIPVVVVTAHFEPEKIIDTLRLGASDYLVKPLVHKDLIEKAFLFSELGVTQKGRSQDEALSVLKRNRKSALLKLRNFKVS